MTETEASRSDTSDDLGPAPDGGRSWLRGHWLPALVVVAVVSGAVGIAAGLLLKSPEDIAASAAAPTPSLITAEVEERVLVNAVDVDVELVSEHTIGVGPTGQAQQGGDRNKAGEGSHTGSASGRHPTADVITGLPVSVGDAVEAGSAVVELSGRPVIALTGTIPPYRDLVPAASGPDVTQLQQALVAQGLLSDSQVDGVYGPATSDAVSQLYSRLGYTAPTTDGGSGEDAKALRDARAAVRQAQDAVTAAGQQGGAAAADSMSLATAQAALADAQADLADIEARTGVILPRSEVVFVPGGSATVLSVSGQIGQEAAQEVLSLGAGELVLRGKVVASQAASLSVGASATVGGLGGSATCRVTALDPADSGRTQVTIGCDTDLDPTALAGTVTARITRATTATTVLCVPVGAVSENADGTTTVITVTGTDTLTRIEVVVGLEADGYVEVRPKDPGALTGDSVVVVGGR